MADYLADLCAKPSIEAALKSYCSALTMANEIQLFVKDANATALTKMDSSDSAPASSGYDKYVSAGHEQEKAAPRSYEFKAMAMCAKIMLKVINAHELPTSDSWAKLHPEAGEVALGGARVEPLAAFNACVAASAQCRAKGEKPSRTFGRCFFHASKCWDAIQPAAKAALLEERTPARMTADFLDGWSKAVSGAAEDEDLATLVWSTDFKGELARRVAARKAVEEAPDPTVAA